ncbi:bacteriocin immunity protein, partial [Salmonella enterica]
MMKFITGGKFMFNFKEKITDYTEMEFIDFLKELSNPTKNGKPLIGKEFEKYQDVLF